MGARLVVSFPGKAVELISKAKGISRVLHNNSRFPEPWVGCPTSLALLDEAIELHQANHLASQSGDHEKMALRDLSHIALCNRLGNVANFVEMVAFGDVAILKESGFDIRKQGGKAATKAVPPAPKFSIRYGGTSGVMIGRATPFAGKASYEMQECTGDPTVEANWFPSAVYPSPSKMKIVNRQPGKTYSFRVRAIGLGGVGAWSQVVTIMAL